MTKKYFSIVFDFPNNVVTSQVIEYAEQLQKEKIIFNINFFIRWGAFIKNFSLLRRRKKEYSNRLIGNISFYPVSRKNQKLNNLLASFIMLIKTFFSKEDEIIIHCRGTSSAFTASIMKKFSTKVKYVYDIRGDVAAEYCYNAKKKSISEEEIKKWLDEDKKVQQICCDNADSILAVSEKLKQKIVDDYKVDEKKISTLPCLADSELFYFDQITRDTQRIKLNISENFVITYAGSLGPWHFTDKMFEVADRLISLNHKILFLVLTPDINIANEKLKEISNPHNILIKNVHKNKVPKFLMAADLAILLREKHPLNEVASPTKFAEYMLCGLKVMITESLPDYAEFVKRNNAGLVITDENNIDEYLNEFQKFYNSNHKNSQTEISSVARNNYSKQQKISILYKLYSEL